MVTLLDLPQEIRHMIYEYVLSIGIIYPYDNRPLQQPKPNFAILHTCRTVHDEAEPLLYRKNTFEMPCTLDTERFFERCLHSIRRRSWLKAVILPMTNEDLPLEDRRRLLDNEIRLFADGLNMLGTGWDEYGSFRDEPHDSYKIGLGCIGWTRKAFPILEYLRLDKLTINMANAYCIDCCCPMTGSAIAAFGDGFAKGMPKVLELEHDQYRVSQSKVRRMIRLWTLMRRSATPVSLKVGLEITGSLFYWLHDDDFGYEDF